MSASRDGKGWTSRNRRTHSTFTGSPYNSPAKSNSWISRARAVTPNVHGEPVLLGQPPHQRDVPRAPPPEPVIVSQHELLHPEPPSQHLPHEILGREPRELRRERQHLHAVQPEPCQDVPLLLRQRQEPGRRRWVHDLERVPVERYQDALESTRA